MSGQSGGNRLRLSKLNDQLTCKLCGGYFIDATTIIECLHSFCRSCIVKYLENNKYCPICEVQVHKSRPLLNIRPDHTLQDIVYKLVPGCYQNEMRCRREFYAKHPEANVQGMSPEARGEPTESHIYSPDESLSLSLEYFNPSTKDSNNTSPCKDVSSKPLLRRYLRCPAAVTVFHLQKLIRAKYGLTDAHRVDVMYKEEPLCSSYTLMDVMYIYHWRRKVPLHLSYRIFESSPKRIKLSEDNVNYKTSLLRAGIDSIDEKDDKSDKKEWKEVQLKISETGVMSITDISHPQSKESTRIENLSEKGCSDGEVLNVDNMESMNAEVLREEVKTEKAVSNNVAHSDSPSVGAKSSATSAASRGEANKSENSATSMNHIHVQLESGKVSIEEPKTLSTKGNEVVEDVHDRSENNNIDGKISQVQKHPVSREPTHLSEEKESKEKSTDENEQTQISKSNNNNNNNTIAGDTKMETRKTAKSTNDMKVTTAGSKIDALSVKLQFQPKISQVNNTASRKTAKDKKIALQTSKRMETRTSENNMKAAESKLLDNTNIKSRLNVVNATNKAGSSTSKANTPKSNSSSTTDETSTSNNETTLTSYPANTVPTSTVTDSTVKEIVSSKSSQVNQLQNTRHERSPTISTDRKTNSHEQASVESQKSSQLSSTNLQKSNYSQSEHMAITQTTTFSTSTDTRPKETPSSVSQSMPASCSISQAISTFPYTVQDLVNSTMLKGTLKNLATAQNTMSGCNIQEHPVCSVPQFAMSQAQCMNMQQVATSLKNSYANHSMNTSCVTSRQQSKVNFEIAGVYTVPPCPDAIPISLMKPTIRKSEVITKGTNLNEICAKIGASGSKINDICAKIGENSKERNKTEARSKSDIPDLLKIGRKSCSPSGSNEQSKHTNIPNVPIYTPSNSTITTENTSVYSNVKDSLRSTPLVSTPSSNVATSQANTQKVSNTKKQSQAVGYKTLRDPPRCWNPTLSKNNYIAVKNQAKDVQNQPQASNLADRNKPIQSKPAKIFKVRNVPRYLGNPASGVKPMYGIGNETKEKEQSSTISKNTSLNMMKIDPKTLSPIVSTVNSPIVSPPPYSPSARNYQNTPFSRDMCRSTGSPISPKNSPVNMLSTNPFIPSPTPNTNPRLIYSHFPPPFPDATRFPNPLIRSPIGIPPASAFHSSLPPSINKLYQRSSYIPQTTGFSQVSQPPTVQRIPPSSYSSPKSPKTTSLTAISPSSYNVPKTETQLPTTTNLENVAFLLSENVTSHEDVNVFNLSKTGNISTASNFAKSGSVVDTQSQKSSSNVVSVASTGVSKQNTTPTSNAATTNITTTTTVPTSSTLTTTAAVTTTLTTTSVCTPKSSSIATEASTQSSASSPSTQVSVQSSQGLKKSETGDSTSSTESKSNMDKEKEKEKDQERSNEKSKETGQSKEDDLSTSKTASDKEKNQDTSESMRQDKSKEKEDKSSCQINGEVVHHSSSSNAVKDNSGMPQSMKEDTDAAGKEQTTSHSVSDEVTGKQQTEQQKQHALANKENAKDVEQVQSKAESQAKKSET